MHHVLFFKKHYRSPVHFVMWWIGPLISWDMICLFLWDVYENAVSRGVFLNRCFQIAFSTRHKSDSDQQCKMVELNSPSGIGNTGFTTFVSLRGVIFHCYFNLCFPDYEWIADVLNMHASYLDFSFFELLYFWPMFLLNCLFSLSICA